MSLEDFKKNLLKIREISVDYGRLIKDKEEIGLDIKNLKAKYREAKVEREVFSEYNKKLNAVEGELAKIREKVMEICRKNNLILNDEIKNVI
ncbi:hypothetical protein HYV89_00060 [Candidatus Woesearchaeota archaeon]|nr:hypothetical protein [Candidatus Woesearchaeota archaeon]